MNRSYIIFLLAILFLIINVRKGSGQEPKEEKLITVSAVIQDEDGHALPDAKISGREGALTVRTDQDGKFNISVSPGSDLRIEKKGFFTKTITADGLSAVVNLQKAPFLMDDNSAVHIAFGKVSKKELSGAIDVINPEEMLTTNGIHSYGEALTGRYFSRTMRNPLVIIDGVARMPYGITAEEIEQITVLKDVNSTVLFGTQGRDGVILIKTKRGEVNKRRINIAVEQTLAQPVILPKYLGSARYMELYNEACANDGMEAAYSAETIENYRSGNKYRYPDVDYYSGEYLREFRPVTRLNTEFSGGNQTIQYYTDLGWTSTGSLYNLGKGKDARTNELNARANVNVKINDFIKASLDATANFVFDKSPNAGFTIEGSSVLGDFWDAAATYHPNYYSPLIPVSMLDEATKASLGKSTKYIDGQYLLGGTTQYQDNVYGNMFRAGYTQNVGRLMSITQGLDIDLKSITEGLTFKTLVGTDLFNLFVQQVANDYAVYQPTWTAVDGVDQVTGLKIIGKDEASGVQNIDDAYFYRQFTAQGILDYSRKFNDVHSLTATGLAYFAKLRRDYLTIDDRVAHLGLRLAYDYDKKFFVDFSGAYNHSIKLKKGNRDILSPTIGLGWVVTEDTPGVDLLKLKVSAGILNTDVTEDLDDRFLLSTTSDASYRRYEGNLQTSGSYGWNESWTNRAVIVTSYANPDLTYEKIKNFNIGMEGYFFEKSLSIDANAFYIKNSGIIVQRSSLYSVMLTNNIPYENYNANSYKGGEVAINWSKEVRDFSINLGANMIYRTSNIDKRDEIHQNDFQYRKDNPVSSIFGLESDGFYTSASDISGSPASLFGVVQPGDIKYKDQDNNGYIDENDAVYLGDYNSSFAYGLNLTLKYKGLSLYALCDGQNGGHSAVSNNYYWVDGDDKYSEEVLNRWTEATAQTATYPRLTTKSSSNNFRTSDFWLYDTSFFRINRVQLTYEFPRGTFSNWGVKDFSLYVRGSNLLMLGKNVDIMQRSIGSQPSYRQFAAGLRVSF